MRILKKQYFILLVFLLSLSIYQIFLNRDTTGFLEQNGNSESQVIISDTSLLEVKETPKFRLVKSESKSQPSCKWTFMVYLCGDNDLEAAAIEDLNELEYSGGSTAEVNIIVLLDRIEGYDHSNGNWTGAKIYYVEDDPLNSEDIISTELENYPEINMGDSSILEMFINYCVTNYPAENYVLDLWDHGSGIYGVCFDDTLPENYTTTSVSKSYLDSAETRDTLINCATFIDLVCYDACLMANAEVAYDLSHCCSYMVASQKTVPNDGFDYYDILTSLKNNITWTAEELGEYMVISFENQYSSNDNTQLSCLDLDKVYGHLKNELKYLANNLTEAVSNFPEVIFDTRMNTPFESKGIDLIEFCENLLKEDLPSDILDAINGFDTFYYKDIIVKNYVHSSLYNRLNGMSIFMPRYRVTYNNAITQYLNWAKNDYMLLANLTEWDIFLDTYYTQVDLIDYAPPVLVPLGQEILSISPLYEKSEYYLVNITESGVYELTVEVILGNISAFFGTYHTIKTFIPIASSELWSPEEGKQQYLRVLVKEIGIYCLKFRGESNGSLGSFMINQVPIPTLTVGEVVSEHPYGTREGIFDDIDDRWEHKQAIDFYYRIELMGGYEYEIDLINSELIDCDLFFLNNVFDLLKKSEIVGLDLDEVILIDGLVAYPNSSFTFIIGVKGIAGYGSFRLGVNNTRLTPVTYSGGISNAILLTPLVIGCIIIIDRVWKKR